VTAPTAYKLGRKPNSGKPRVSLAPELVEASYSPPPAVDYYSAVPADSWGMDGNDAVGDCTCADVDHEIKAVEVSARNAETASTDAEVLAAYSAITGYTPDDPSSDQGAEMQDVRAYWQKTGFTLGGKLHKILLFAEVQHSDTTLVRWCLDQIGAVGLGVNFPSSAMDQFNANEPWSVVEGSDVEGGHAIALVGYDSEFWYVLTWGKVQKVEPAWFAKYVEEAWISLSEDFINSASGDDPRGETLYALGQQFAVITGKPNPVPSPVPTPAPSPTPAPDDDPDVAFAAVLKPWVEEHHVGGNQRMAIAAEQWLAEREL
jgi:hypothetical protein